MRLLTLGLLGGLSLAAVLITACSDGSSGADDDGGGRHSGGSAGAPATGGATSGGVSGTGPSGAGGGAGALASGGGAGAPIAGMAGASGGASGAGGVAGLGAGSGGALGGAGAGGVAVAGAGAGGGSSGMGPTPPSATARFPFPQNRRSASCTYPTTFDNQDVRTVYDAWKRDLVTADGAGGFQRVKRPAEPGLNVNSTVSEGISYGMMIAVYMDDQPLFDDLWRYSLLHSWTYTTGFGGSQTMTPTILMNWYILEDGNVSTQATGGQDGTGAATDADEDMAWALVMASEQWGGQGSLDKSYLDYARQLLGDIWRYEIDSNRLPKNGSSWGSDTSLNISYFAPSHYRVFAEVSGEARWASSVVDYVYTVIGNNLTASSGNQANGLVPAWSQANGSPAAVGMGQSPLPYTYQYDSCRTPFRIGLDACFFNDTRARDYVAKTSQFFAGIGAPSIVDGYQLNGTPNPQYPNEYGGLSAAFIGPAAVGAMHDPAFQSFIDAAYGMLKQNNMWCGGQYYDESWTLLSMLMLTGNFLDYTQYP